MTLQLSVTCASRVAFYCIINTWEAAMTAEGDGNSKKHCLVCFSCVNLKGQHAKSDLLKERVTALIEEEIMPTNDKFTVYLNSNLDSDFHAKIFIYLFIRRRTKSPHHLLWWMRMLLGIRDVNIRERRMEGCRHSLYVSSLQCRLLKFVWMELSTLRRICHNFNKGSILRVFSEGREKFRLWQTDGNLRGNWKFPSEKMWMLVKVVFFVPIS